VTQSANPLRVEVARETEAVDLARFVQEIGLAVTRHGSRVVRGD
jgi:UDP-N-acetylglucosamine enolpyruvyl transferase